MLVNFKAKKPKIALVVGSGAWKALGSLELFHFLQKVGIEINLLVGCSGGAGAITCMALDIPLPDLKTKLARAFPTDFGDLFELKKISKFIGHQQQVDKRAGFIESDVFLSFYKRFFEGRILEELKIPCIIQTTDLDSGKGFVIDKGDIASAVAASSITYPIVAPLHYQNHWLIDGGFSHSLPIHEILNKDIDLAIIVNSVEIKTEVNNVLDFWLNFFKHIEENWIKKFVSSFLQSTNIRMVYLEYQIDRIINIWDFKSLDYIFSIYAAQTEKFQNQILSAVYNEVDHEKYH